MYLRLSEIDFRTPEFLVIYYYVVGCIAVGINFFVVYLLIFHSRKMDSFKYYMLCFQISCLLFDIHVSLLMQPIPLFPIKAGHSVGILPIKFEISNHSLMTILFFLDGLQASSLNICFLRKHQAITKIGNKYLLPRRVHNSLVILLLGFAFSFTLSFYFSKIPKTEQWWIIDNDYSIFRTQFEQLPNFDVYKPTVEFLATPLLIGAGCIQSAFIVSFLVIQMLKTLSKCKTNLSKSALNRHKTVLRSLVAQFLTTPIGILPRILIVLPLLIYFKNAQVFTWCMLMVTTTHSTINSLVLIFTLPEFRDFVLFCNKARKKGKNRTHSSVSFVGQLSRCRPPAYLS